MSSLLICLDFDGTLAELDPDPYNVRIHPDAERAIRRLASLPETEVVLLTGRHIAGIRQVLPDDLPVTLIGSHGAEPGPELGPEDLDYLERIEQQLHRIATDGAYVEAKPFQRVLHVAKVADPARAEAILAAVSRIDTGGRPTTQGHNVVEFSAVETTKGTWLREYKKRFNTTVFAGDDDTDEHAIAVLGPNDFSIKVGHKPSTATRRVPNVDAMAQLLTQLADEREAWSATR
ncbi:trehalose-phosphatase [Corynebacterium wankanglinii]|uniref:HAD hydrolase family protein n=1 Tax=Corynebacterium wankanglinii TaxID=2735136 RepID=A0A838CKX7_9CORY|nr:trehalose-phosphatase [Corynebacterium wankanglinii]MBA1835587.1 HAD hydrolase family protein [Corynebacterium wankanglinii]